MPNETTTPEMPKRRSLFLRKRFWLLFLLLAVAGFFARPVLFPRYTARAIIQILSEKPYYIYRDDSPKRPYEVLVATQIELMRSPLICEKAMESPAMARMPLFLARKDPARWLGNHLRFERTKNSELLTVAFTSPSPADSELIVNTVVNAYFEYYESQSYDWNARLINQLNLEFNRQQSSARILQDEIRTGMEAAARSGQPSQGTPPTGFATGELILKDLYLCEAKLDATRAELKATKEYAKEVVRNIPASVLKNAIDGDPTMQSLWKDQKVLNEKLQSLKETTIKEDDPRIVDLKAKLGEIGKKIEQNLLTLGETKVKEIRDSMTHSIEQTIWEKEMAVRALEIQVETLRSRYKEQLTVAASRTVQIVDVSFQQAQLQRINAVLDHLQTRIVSLQTEMNAPPQVQLKRKATRPTEPD